MQKDILRSTRRNSPGSSIRNGCITFKTAKQHSSAKFFCMDAESPAWDTALLEAIGYKNIITDTEISSRIYKCCNEFYNPTPMFLIRAEK